MGTAAGMLPLTVPGAAPTTIGWTVCGGDQAATHYSPLNQINRENVSRLRPAWVHNAPPGTARYRGSVECTPLMVDGVMYIVGAARPELGQSFASERKPIPWVRVHRLPGFVYFSHQVHHKQARLEGAVCHGTVADRIVMAQEKSTSMTA